MMYEIPDGAKVIIEFVASEKNNTLRTPVRQEPLVKEITQKKIDLPEHMEPNYENYCKLRNLPPQGLGLDLTTIREIFSMTIRKFETGRNKWTKAYRHQCIKLGGKPGRY